MSPISVECMLDNYTPIDSGDEVVQEDWCYSYDIGFLNTPSDPNMRVLPEWVGLPARDCCIAWEYFQRPIHNYSI